MSDERPLTPLEAIERTKRQLQMEMEAKAAASEKLAAEAAEARAKLEALDREAKDFLRLAEKFNLKMGPSDLSLTVPAMSPPVKSDAPISSARLTMGALIEKYVSDPESPYRALRFTTRRHYDTLINHLRRDCSDMIVVDIKRDDINTLYDKWTEGRTKRQGMGHALITMFRMAVNYGVKKLENPECERLAIVLHTMSFPPAKGRTAHLTAEQADAIIARARLIGRPSVALAQAFQFDCPRLTQKDVIGEWVPVTEKGISDVVFEGEKWLRGIRWDEIDESMILRHLGSRDGRSIEINLRDCPRVMAELEHFPSFFQKNGPVIVSETTLRPWTPTEFRRYWRRLARDCGIPDNVRNMDSRAPAKTRDNEGRKKPRPTAAEL